MSMVHIIAYISPGCIESCILCQRRNSFSALYIAKEAQYMAAIASRTSLCDNIFPSKKSYTIAKKNISDQKFVTLRHIEKEPSPCNLLMTDFISLKTINFIRLIRSNHDKLLYDGLYLTYKLVKHNVVL